PRFPGELRRRRSREFGFLYHRPRVGELDRTWPTQHAPGNRHSRRSRTSPGQRRRSIIGNPHSQIERLGPRRRDRLGLTGATLHPWTAFGESDKWRCIAAGLAERLDLPECIQIERNRRGLAVRAECPGQFLFAEVLRHANRENAPLPAWQEMRGLALIRTAGL